MVQQLKNNGYWIKEACEAVGISRSNYYAAKSPQSSCKEEAALKDYDLVEKIKQIKTEHPFWGYRRVCAWLKHREGILINEKKVRRIMKEHKLMATQTVHRAKRTPQRNKPRAKRPQQYWGIDMTKFLIPNLGWVYLVIVLDWFTKKVVGWDMSLRSRTKEWKEAMEKALQEEFPNGVRGKGLKLISDNGSQPTSRSFMKDMATLEIEQIFTSYDNPKGNADTERMMRTIKEEVIWLNEFSGLEEAEKIIGSWIENDYNKNYVHSALGYLSPEEFEQLYYREILEQAA